MTRFFLFFCLFASLSSALADKAPVPILDPNRTPYPRSSLHDFSNLQDAPAGKHGFLTTKDEHFYWPNGQRARFWGINIANTSLQESDADIDAMIDNFKTAGFNLVRLHHFDERGGIIDLDKPDSRHFIEARVKKLDYWIYKAKQAGLYVYLDLLDYRRFKEGDGVPKAEEIGRSAKPYAVFNRRLIELQKEYARKLLRDHVNSYTGLAYADDPAIVMIEVYDENGLFMRRGLWRSMPQPYAAEFKKLWNQWLQTRYENTGALAGAWTDDSGKSALFAGEKLENGTVEVPALTWTPNQVPEKDRPYAAMPRRNDGALFAYEIHRRYLREMKTYLREELGVKIAICATGRFDDLADLRAMSEEMDFTAANFYYDHPYWGQGTKPWILPSYFHNTNPLHDIDSTSMAAATSLARIKGKPFVVREWNYAWPNFNRGSGIIEAAAYAALHDVDAMILFVYETKPTARVSYFNVRSDPSRWGLVGVAAQIYLKNLIQPSRHKIVVPYNVVDTFTYTKYHQPFYALGWATRVENDFFDGPRYKADGKTDLILTPGRSGVGTYEGAPAVLHTENLSRDLAGRTVTTPQYLAEYGFSARRGGKLNLQYNGLLFDRGAQRQRDLLFGVQLNPLLGSTSRVPIGTNAAANIANGFVDSRHKKMVFGSLEPFDVLRAALDAMQIFYDVPNDHDNTEHNAFRTDTGEIYRDAASGRMVIQTPQFQALCGNLVGVGGMASGLSVRNGKSGTLVALAVDGKPLVESRQYVIKMVTDARNVDEVAARDPRFSHRTNGQWRLDVYGEGPVTTAGKSTAAPMQISLGGFPVIDVYLEGGSWELYVNGAEKQFYCDTPGARFTLHNGTNKGQTPIVAQAESKDGTRAPLALETGGSAEYPADAALVREAG